MATSPTSPRPTSGPTIPARTPTPTSRLDPTTTPLTNVPVVHPTSPPSVPKVAELQSMFPTVEVPVIEMILESCGGSQDRAIEQLLSMTDPEFHSDDSTHVRTEEESQLDLDAQFARSLAMQDEQDMHEMHERRGQGNQLPYQPRVKRTRPDQPPPPPQQTGENGFQGYDQSQRSNQNNGGNPPGMLAVEDKLNQFAEAGKQTFTSLFSKAKAKYSEYQSQQEVNKNNGAQQQWGGASTGTSNWQSQGGYHGTPTPGGGRGGDQNRARGSLWGDDRSYSARSESLLSESSMDGPSPISPHTANNPPIRQNGARWTPSDAYDDPIPPFRSLSNSGSNKIEVGGRKSPGVGSPDKGSGTMGKIDPAKLGILPKKRVDLLSTSPPPNTLNTKPNMTKDDDDNDPNPSLPSAPKSLVAQIPKTPPTGKSPYGLGDSDDELEYTKNPFDER